VILGRSSLAGNHTLTHTRTYSHRGGGGGGEHERGQREREVGRVEEDSSSKNNFKITNYKIRSRILGVSNKQGPEFNSNISFMVHLFLG
jgi:hypothetical protein